MEQEGVWVDAGGLKLRIARMGNPKYNEYARQLGKPHAMQIRHGAGDAAKVLEDVIKKAMARHVLLGWENLEDDAGSPIPYSEAKAMELLTGFPDFYRMVLEFAQEAEHFKRQSREDAKGNSEAVSSGSSTGDSTKSS